MYRPSAPEALLAYAEEFPAPSVARAAFYVPAAASVGAATPAPAPAATAATPAALTAHLGVVALAVAAYFVLRRR